MRRGSRWRVSQYPDRFPSAKFQENARKTIVVLFPDSGELKGPAA